MPVQGPYSLEVIDRNGDTETKMESIGSEQMAITNATLIKRGAPYSTFIIKDRTGREVQRF